MARVNGSNVRETGQYVFDLSLGYKTRDPEASYETVQGGTFVQEECTGCIDVIWHWGKPRQRMHGTEQHGHSDTRFLCRKRNRLDVVRNGDAVPDAAVPHAWCNACPGYRYQVRKMPR